MNSVPGAIDYGWHDTESSYLAEYLLPAILPIIDGIKPTSILDLGCGNGKLCSILHDHGAYNLVGVDPGKSGIEIASEAYPELSFYQYGVDDDPKLLLNHNKEKFDLVISTEVVEHLYSPHRLPLYAGEVLKSGGKLVVTTPYHGFLKNLALILAGRFDKHFDPLWEGGHIKFWSRATLEKLMNDNGFKTVSFSGVGRVPYLWMSMVMVFEKRG